jgi:integrase
MCKGTTWQQFARLCQRRDRAPLEPQGGSMRCFRHMSILGRISETFRKEAGVLNESWPPELREVGPQDRPGVRRRDRSSQIVDESYPMLPTATLELISGFQRSSLAESTQRSLRSHWAAFSRWCDLQGVSSLPAAPVTGAGYLAYAASILDSRGAWSYSSGTLGVWLSSINKAHELAGFTKPGHNTEVARTLNGIRRERIRPLEQKTPIRLSDLRTVVGAIDCASWPQGVIGARDTSILLIGFGGAFRRSELAALRLCDVTMDAKDGLLLRVRKSKTDQLGVGMTKAIPFGLYEDTCAPCALVRWLALKAAHNNGNEELRRVLELQSAAPHSCTRELPASRSTEPLFTPVVKGGNIKQRQLSGNVINDVVKRRLTRAGYDAATFGAHSLRAGFVTEALVAGATHHQIMRQTGHKSSSTVEIYAREKTPLENNAIALLGL